MYYSVKKFRAAYEALIPCLPDKTQWPQSNHGFFMNPPLLRATAGRRKQQRHKGCLDGTSNKGRHRCPICFDYGHHWHKCKNGDPADIAAILAERGSPKRRKKPSESATTETSIVLASSAKTMSFPAPIARSGACANQMDVVPLCIEFPPASRVQAPSTNKGNNKKKETKKKGIRKEEVKQKQEKKEIEKQMEGNAPPNLLDSPAMCTRSEVSSLPSSPAMSTRSKRKLDIDLNF